MACQKPAASAVNSVRYSAMTNKTLSRHGKSSELEFPQGSKGISESYGEAIFRRGKGANRADPKGVYIAALACYPTVSGLSGRSRIPGSSCWLAGRLCCLGRIPTQRRAGSRNAFGQMQQRSYSMKHATKTPT